MGRHTYDHFARAHTRPCSTSEVIVFLMVLEVITPCDVTRRLVLSCKSQHGGSEVPSTHRRSPLNDSISKEASALLPLLVPEYEARFTNRLIDRI